MDSKGYVRWNVKNLDKQPTSVLPADGAYMPSSERILFNFFPHLQKVIHRNKTKQTINNINNMKMNAPKINVYYMNK